MKLRKKQPRSSIHLAVRRESVTILSSITSVSLKGMNEKPLQNLKLYDMQEHFPLLPKNMGSREGETKHPTYFTQSRWQ